MDRLEDLILEGFPVNAADSEAWRRWAAGATRKKKKRRKKKLPKAPEGFLLSISLKNKVREEYPDRITEGLSTGSHTYLQGGCGIRWLGSIRHRSPREGEGLGGKRRAARRNFFYAHHCGGLQCLLPGLVLQRCGAEPIVVCQRHRSQTSWRCFSS